MLLAAGQLRTSVVTSHHLRAADTSSSHRSKVNGIMLHYSVTQTCYIDVDVKAPAQHDEFIHTVDDSSILEHVVIYGTNKKVMNYNQ